MRTKDRTKKSNSNKIAILLLLIAFIIITGAALAYFSDFVTGQASGVTGTLDLRATGTTILRHYQQGGAEATPDNAASITNLNPGDIIEIKYSLSNEGNKSAWIRDLVTFTAGENHADRQLTLAEIKAAFVLYPESATIADIRSGGATAIPLTTTDITNGISFNTESEEDIINGKVGSTGVETEATGVNGPIATGYKLYFKPDAGNVYQNTKNINFSVKTQAMQYRNNETVNWGDVTTAEFTLGTE